MYNLEDGRGVERCLEMRVFKLLDFSVTKRGSDQDNTLKETKKERDREREYIYIYFIWMLWKQHTAKLISDLAPKIYFIFDLYITHPQSEIIAKISTDHI